MGRARHPGPSGFREIHLEAFNVGGWLTHGYLALDTRADFLAVTEHRLIPARIRGVWADLRRKGIHSVWSPASQESSQVGHAGVGIVSLQGAPVAMPTFATAALRNFSSLSRLVRSVLPLGDGRLLHLAAVYCFQGATDDAEKLGLTDELFDAVFGELSVVGMGSTLYHCG